MNDYLLKVFNRYRDAGILVDTNILLLYVVGHFNPNRILSFKRTAQFVVEDFELLCSFLQHFRKIISTPNILSEVNSLCQQISEPIRTSFFDMFSKQIEIIDEYYIESKTVTRREEFTKFGLTDSVILNLSNKRFLVLTDDFKLSQYLEHQNIDVINFNHIRTFAWT